LVEPDRHNRDSYAKKQGRSERGRSNLSRGWPRGASPFSGGRHAE
jgi:hypothetical protein